MTLFFDDVTPFCVLFCVCLCPSMAQDLNAYYVQSECISRAAFFAKHTEEKTKVLYFMIIPEGIKNILHMTCLFKNLPPQLDRIVVFESYYTNVDLMAEINNYRQINHDTVVIRVLLRKMYVL